MNEKEREIVFAKNSLANTQVWKEIKYFLFEEIKEKAPSSISDRVVGMLSAISIVDDWKMDYEKLIKEATKED